MDEIEVYGSEAQSGTQLATYSFEVPLCFPWGLSGQAALCSSLALPSGAEQESGQAGLRTWGLDACPCPPLHRAWFP